MKDLDMKDLDVKVQAARIVWARLDRRLRHGIENGAVLTRTQTAERKAYARWRDLVDQKNELG